MAPERSMQYSLHFPKTSTPTSTASSNKSDCSSCGLELSIVGQPAPRSRTSAKVTKNIQKRPLRSAPIKPSAAAKVAPPAPVCRDDRPWTTSKRKVLKNAWSLEQGDSEDVSSLRTPSESAAASVRSSRRGASSVCSVSASSAGDVSALEDDSNSQYSRAKSLSDPSGRRAPEVAADGKFSFPVPPHALQSRLQDAYEEEKSDDEFIEGLALQFRNFHADEEEDELNPEEEVKGGEALHKLTEIQDKVLSLVESQQACSRQTWMVMQQLSAALDALTKNSQLSEQQHTTKFAIPAAPPLPEPLLLQEAAGCALRLADILALIGSTVGSRRQVVQEEECSLGSTATAKVFPASPTDLQLQKEKLKPVTTTSPGLTGGLLEELNATLKLRRASIHQSDQESDASEEEWRD